MYLKEQRYVCTLADTKSLSLAAKQLFISQSTLSIYISNLEKNLGMPLFDRNNKKFILTYFGETYVRYARRMLEHSERFEEEMNSIKLNYKERLRLGIQNTRSSYILPKMLVEITSRFPQIDTMIVENSASLLEEELLLGQLDVVFSVCPKFRKELKYEFIFADEIVFIINKNHPSAKYYVHKDTDGLHWIDLSMLKEEQVVLPAKDHALYYYSQQVLRKHAITPKKVKLIRHIFTIIGLINEGYGIGFCYASYLNYAKDTGNLIVCKIPDPSIKINFNGAYRPDNRQAPLIEDIIRIAQDLEFIKEPF